MGQQICRYRSAFGLSHNRRTRCRASVNAEPIARQFEAGVPPVAARLGALGKLADAGYPIGLVIAPIMPIPDWRRHYAELFDAAQQALANVRDLDLTFELITHRFTPGSKNILLNWYPNTKLDLDETTRSAKLNKFGGRKFVYPNDTMRDLRSWLRRNYQNAFRLAVCCIGHDWPTGRCWSTLYCSSDLGA